MNKNNIAICLEKKEDYREVENLIRESFWNVYRPGCSEHYVIHVLREDPAFVGELDFVMYLNKNQNDVEFNTSDCKDSELIGQNMFMRTVIEADDGRTIPVLTMGPICITPSLKRRGYGKSGFDYSSNFGIRYHDLPEDADASFFLCKELIPGYLDEITGVYQTPKGYYVEDSDVEEFDKEFPYKEKLKLPGQIF